jgi:hypothetical protein
MAFPLFLFFFLIAVINLYLKKVSILKGMYISMNFPK